ncbi:F-box-like protein [Cinnamomum micranthum f. kanehirae]|uniref:F-box-like protein n=1 Tax=Cinnamomum micranthum f. kanehirae TaxID=337451 RepID=A0A443PKQ4_9MAGN|nr:F-box-like protein [Cinnamomum micranthum f. kanehirae]
MLCPLKISLTHTLSFSTPPNGKDRGASLSPPAFDFSLLVLPQMKIFHDKPKISAQDSSTKRIKPRDGYQSIGIQLIPQEIIMDILSRLPIYSLFQCTLVSKAWRDIIIHNPIFATMQHNRALENQNSILLMFSQDHSPEVNLYLVERVEAGHRKLRVMDAKLTNHTGFNGSLRILGSCNGLLCISFGSMDGPLYVSNPITGECKQLPSKESKYIHISGIGFDSVRKEYKVVRRVSKYDLPYMVDDCSWKVEIHTLGTNTWREIGNFPWWDGKDLLYKFSDVLVNGRLHWCSFFPTPVRITSLDMSDEQFGVVPTPEFTSSCHLHLMTWKGCLTIAQRLRGDLSIHIWVMKEYNVRESWTKQFNVTMPTWFYAGMNYWPFDDESLIDDIQVIDHPRLRAEYYNNSPRCYLGVMAHVGSLVSLKNYHGKEKAGWLKFLPRK